MGDSDALIELLRRWWGLRDSGLRLLAWLAGRALLRLTLPLLLLLLRHHLLVLGDHRRTRGLHLLG